MHKYTGAKDGTKIQIQQAYPANITQNKVLCKTIIILLDVYNIPGNITTVHTAEILFQ